MQKSVNVESQHARIMRGVILPLNDLNIRVSGQPTICNMIEVRKG